MMKVTLPALLGGSITIIIVFIFVFYLAEIGVSAPSRSYATDSLDNEIQEPATFLVTNLSSNDNNGSSAISANTTMAILLSNSTVVYETEAFIAPPTLKTFVIY